MEWSAAQYSKFLDERTRPARDLLSAVPLAQAGEVVDLGCGPGNSTQLLRERFGDANVLGIDLDPDMIATARAQLPDCRFEQADIAKWHPRTPPDLIFANASLQWLPQHKALFPRLIGLLRPGGVLAVQMPDNLAEPSHLAMRKLAKAPKWDRRLKAVAEIRQPLMSPVEMHALLRPLCARLDIWRTTYHPELAGVDGIVEWFRGSALRPYLEALEQDQHQAFLSAYRSEILASYPENAGRVLLPFPRYFLVATATQAL